MCIRDRAGRAAAASAASSSAGGSLRSRGVSGREQRLAHPHRVAGTPRRDELRTLRHEDDDGRPEVEDAELVAARQERTLLAVDLRLDRAPGVLSLIHISEPTRLLSISYAV